MREGNCYAASEALFHLLGGKKAGWKACYVRQPKLGKYFTHWFLKHESGLIIDPTRVQFKYWGRGYPDYTKAVGAGFLTKKPSKRAKELMKRIVWQ